MHVVATCAANSDALKISPVTLWRKMKQCGFDAWSPTLPTASTAAFNRFHSEATLFVSKSCPTTSLRIGNDERSGKCPNRGPRVSRGRRAACLGMFVESTLNLLTLKHVERRLPREYLDLPGSNPLLRSGLRRPCYLWRESMPIVTSRGALDLVSATCDSCKVCVITRVPSVDR